MNDIFDTIKALNEKKYISSIPTPPVPNTVDNNSEEIDQIEKTIQKIESISKELSAKEPITKGSKCRYFLESFLIPGIVAVAIILVTIFKGDICKGDKDCGICWCDFISYLITLLVIFSFAIFYSRWKKIVEKNHEKCRDQELKERNDYLKKQSDILELRLSICKRQLCQLEFKEQLQKLQIDEYARDKEHLRKIDLREQERFAILPDKIIELGKIKKTIEKEENERNSNTTDNGDVKSIKSTETSLLSDK